MLRIYLHFLFLLKERQRGPAPVREIKILHRDTDKFAGLPWESHYRMVCLLMDNQLGCDGNGIIFPGLVMVQNVQPLV